MGYFLHRNGVQAARATGTILFRLIINFSLTFLVAAGGMISQGYNYPKPGITTSLVYFIILINICYLLTIAAKPHLFRRNQILAPLFDAGIRGHLIAAAVRMPHVMTLVLGHWGALLVWGIGIPFYKAMILIPVILLVTALPITPLGLGITQVAQVLLFSPYVNLPTAGAREAAVIAFSLVYYVLAVITQIVIGLLCWSQLNKIR